MERVNSLSDLGVGNRNVDGDLACFEAAHKAVEKEVRTFLLEPSSQRLAGDVCAWFWPTSRKFRQIVARPAVLGLSAASRYWVASRLFGRP